MIEWSERLQWVRQVQEEIQQGKPSKALGQMRSRGITHLVQPANQELLGPAFRLTYKDPFYRVYQLASPGERSESGR